MDLIKIRILVIVTIKTNLKAMILKLSAGITRHFYLGFLKEQQISVYNNAALYI